MKEEDKWKTKRIELAEMEKLSNKKKQKSRPRDTEGTNNDEDAAKEVAPETEASKRPPGVKKAKEALRRGGGGEACMEALDKMWSKKEAFDKEKEKAREERFLVALEVEKSECQMKKKKLKRNCSRRKKR